MEKIVLKKPIQINGKQVKELTYDTEAISVEALANAWECRGKADKSKSLAVVQEFDMMLFLYIGFTAVIAVNPDIDMTDLERVQGSDQMKFIGIGRHFILDQNNQSEDVEV